MLIVSSFLVAVGVFMLILRTNVILLILGLELIFNGFLLRLFYHFYVTSSLSQVGLILIIFTIGICETVLLLSLALKAKMVDLTESK
jgi:NADH:ubiquinone oxidoreductase subunit K